jgi:hypothetical protein
LPRAGPLGTPAESNTPTQIASASDMMIVIAIGISGKAMTIVTGTDKGTLISVSLRKTRLHFD